MMGSIKPEGFSRVDLGKVLDALHRHFESDEAIRSALNESCIEGPAPSTETFMHAALLSIPGVKVVGHVHPTPLLSLLCLEGAEEWAGKRLYPDEIVCCGPATCFIPYVAPGLDLARSIELKTEVFQLRYGVFPRTYWLQNHGLIAVGGTAAEVESACLMAVKAARVILGALQTGEKIRWLTDEEIAHIYNWPDEHARQRALWGDPGLGD
jgi:rhamnose utilization protein RhaD (predicted bifunctional aldolase and dehydrogenase)